MIKTLAIETSCDDTSIAIVNFDGGIFNIENIVSYSQIDQHSIYGGVVPEIASRLHEEKILNIVEKIGNNNIQNVDFISVTSNPGLPGSLLVGITLANLLGNFFNKPVINVNHIHGHIFSLLLEKELSLFDLPTVILTASGGHNDLYFLNKIDKYSFNIDKIGQTIDDAAGECFDKVSRMLGGPYPGGKRIQDNAKKGTLNEKFRFKRIFLSSDKFEFSFSGMKSQAYYFLKKHPQLTQDDINDFCFEFQESIVEVMGKKLLKSALKYGVNQVGLSGGVSANDRLVEYIQNLIKLKYKDINRLIIPSKKIYSTDNAAMIGVVGIINYLSNKKGN